MYEYPEVRLVGYGNDEDDIGRAVFTPVCPICRRFVKADKSITVNHNGEFKETANATCSKCGRVEMPFMGYI